MATDLVEIDPESPQPEVLERAATAIRCGQVVAIPTDALYTLVADPYNLRAVTQVFKAKGREPHNSLPILIRDTMMAEELANELNSRFFLLARRFWPGPLTIIVKADPKLPLKVTANTGNVALRVPSAEVPLAIIRSAGLPITATSANLHGEVECTTAMEVRDQLGDRLSIIVDGGPCPGVMPSTIVDLTTEGTWRLLRQGAIPEEQIIELLGQE